jgi:pimeloyl-ACP methyl ester carboxylesterase
MNTHIRTLLLCTLALATLMLGACQDDPVAPGQDNALTPAERGVQELAVVNDANCTSYAGVIGETNQYEICVPTDWNGEFILYAHGFVDSYEPIQLPYKDNIDAIRDELVGMGYAFGYCSFRENGFAVKDGIWATRVVGQIFRSKVKQEPAYTWLMGHSLGGLVAVNLVEKHPGNYDGILTMAGMLGGSRAEIDYMGDIWNLFELFYGDDVLPGNPCELAMPPADVVQRVVGAVMANPDGLGAIAALTPLAGADPNQFVESLITAIVFNYRGQGDLAERLDGDCAYDNFERTYTARFPLPAGIEDWVNATIPRYCRSNAADNYFGRYYEPTGRLGVEMMTLHLVHDPIVPVFHEQLYAQKVAMNGNIDLLEQRVLNGYGHTLEIPTSDVIQAFTDLRAKVCSSGTPLVAVQ